MPNSSLLDYPDKDTHRSSPAKPENSMQDSKVVNSPQKEAKRRHQRAVQGVLCGASLWLHTPDDYPPQDTVTLESGEKGVVPASTPMFSFGDNCAELEFRAISGMGVLAMKYKHPEDSESLLETTPPDMALQFHGVDTVDVFIENLESLKTYMLEEE